MNWVHVLVRVNVKCKREDQRIIKIGQMCERIVRLKW